jgi:pyrimidine operon attenuation protein / uracil phosphoribosyltransferase
MKPAAMPTLPEVNPLLAQLAQQIGTVDRRTALVGIHTGGVWVAERLHALLKPGEPLGTLAVTLHRDDYGRIGLHPQAKTTRIPFDVNGKQILLIDDVIHTGRTIRAALNELFDFGRPASVKLVCLADRGGRELPFAPDYVGVTLELEPAQELVLIKDDDKLRLQVQARK